MPRPPRGRAAPDREPAGRPHGAGRLRFRPGGPALQPTAPRRLARRPRYHWRVRRRPLRLRLAGLALALAGAAAAPAAPARADDPAFAAARKAYERYLERPSLWLRHRGRQRLAETGDARALEILTRSYARPEEPKEVVRALLVDLVARHFDAPAHLPALADWRRKHAKARDAWLWTQALEIEGRHGRVEEAVAVVVRAGDPWLRAAALCALARLEAPEGLEAARAALPDATAAEPGRTLLLEAAAEVLSAHTARRQDPRFEALALALVERLGEATTTPRARLGVVRRLRRALNRDEWRPDPAVWREWIAGRPPPPAEPAVGPPTFFGLPASGRRIAFVIDLSDSMLTPLTHEEVEDLKKVPVPPRRRPVVTGGDAPDARPGGPAPAPAAPPDLPWEEIRTRFDAARAFLRLALERLEPEEEFVVIGFGTRAEALGSTPGLRRATPAAVARAIAEVLAIEPGPRKPDRPHGTLWGYTNLHGGLLRALELAGARPARADAYVAPDVLEGGCDTVFLLSDGVPSWDDHAEWDVREAGDVAGDPESRSVARDAERVHWYGPYAVQSWLIEDIRRANLFVRAEVHAVGFGEADPRLLQRLAYDGLGRALILGGGSGR